MILPYALHPLVAAEIYLPHMRLVSWLTKPNDFKPESDIPSLKGKVIIVTGGNGGLGQETIYQLACHQPRRIYLGARSEQRARKAIEEVQEMIKRRDDTIEPTVQWLKLDLSDFESVHRAAVEVLENEKRLDLLILNAGTMTMSPAKSPSGHDLSLATNHLGHFLLLRLLMPLLEQTASNEAEADVRVISVASEAYHIAPPDFMNLIENHEDLCSSSGYTRYGISKAANVLFASEIARRYGAKNIQSMSLHPGLILTDLFSHARDGNFIVRYGLPPIARLVFDDVSHGALNTLWCAGSVQLDKTQNGQYFTPIGKARKTHLTEDRESAERLWSWSEEQLKAYLP